MAARGVQTMTNSAWSTGQTIIVNYRKGANLFDAPDPLNRKVIGHAREEYKAVVLSEHYVESDKTWYVSIRMLDGAFAEAKYKDPIWTRKWQWRVLPKQFVGADELDSQPQTS